MTSANSVYARYCSGMLAVAIFLSVWANPTFSRFGGVELAMSASILLLGAGVSYHWLTQGSRTLPTVHWPLAFFSLSILSSALLGLIAGAPPFAVFRSSAPYILIVLALPWVLVRPLNFNRGIVTSAILAAGVVQCLYLFYLYYVVNERFDSVFYIMVNRITLLDPRTTIPVFLVLTGIALALCGRQQKLGYYLGLIVCAILGVLASLTTLTRSHLISVFGGLFVVIAFAALRSKETSSSVPLRVLGAAAISALIAGSVTLLFPSLAILPKAVLLRQAIEAPTTEPQIDMLLMRETIRRSTTAAQFEQLFSAKYDEDPPMTADALLKALAVTIGIDEAKKVLADYALAKLSQGDTSIFQSGIRRQPPAAELSDELMTRLTKVVVETNAGIEQKLGTGRLEDEWYPAIGRIVDGSLFEKLFGIGAGRPFVTGSGEHRTYIHNYVIYLLLYQGGVGLLSFCIFVGWLSFRALRQWWKHDDCWALVSLGALATLYSNTLFFAVHKLVSFNLAVLAMYLLVSTFDDQARSTKEA